MFTTKPGALFPRWKKFIGWFLAIFLGIFILVVSLCSPLAKYLVEKNDERWLGRHIEIDWAYVNPFTGYVYLHDVEIYEARKDSLFLSIKGLSGDFAMLKLLNKTYEVHDVTLDYPRGTVNQDKNLFNFDDLVVRFSGDSTKKDKEPSRVSLLDIRINHGEFFYNERVIPIHYVVRDLNLISSGIRWDADTIATSYSFLSQNGKGGLKGNFTINIKTDDYRLATDIRNFDLELIRQYLWELINYGMFSAQLDGSIKASGNFNSSDSLNLKGRIVLKDFHFGKTTKDDYVAFDELLVVIRGLSPMRKEYLFDSVILKKPFFKYEKFDSLNNMEMLFGKNGSNVTDITSQPGRFNLIIELGRYLKTIARNFFQGRYTVSRLAVTDGHVRYSDFSLAEQFSLDANSLTIRGDSINKQNPRIKLHINSGIKPYGDLSVMLSINPLDSGDFDMKYRFGKLPASVFNPYLVSYTSYSLDRGTIELAGLWNVRNGDINSENHLLVIDPRVSRRVKNKDIKWLPLPVIMAVVRERGNVIDYNIPIKGNLKNPHFGLSDVITDILKNIFVKPLTIPYGIEVRNVQQEIDNALILRWDTRQSTLHHNQRKFIERMAEFLEDNSEASITVVPRNYALKEKEQILFFEAKKKYFLVISKKDAREFTKDDSAAVDRMSVKDPAFVKHIKRGLSDTVMFTIQEKCRNFVGQEKVNAKYKQLLSDRERSFRSMLTNENVGKRVKILSQDDNSVPYSGFSCYRIQYHGDIPKSLKRAYEEMNELLDDNPQRKHFKKRTLARSVGPTPGL